MGKRVRRWLSGAGGVMILAVATAAGLAVSAPAAQAAGCVQGEQVSGFDVSSLDGAIDWGQAVCENFAYLRAVDGTTTDSRFAANESGATAAGITLGAYDLFEPDQSAATQASDFLKVYRPRPGDLRPALDVESANGQSPAQIIAGMTTWINAVEKAVGVRPVIRTSSSFWTTSVGDSTAFTSDPLWVIDLTQQQVPTVPASNWGGHGWAFWFYSDTGTVSGDTSTGNTHLDEFSGPSLASTEIPATTTVVVTSHTAKPVAGQPVKVGVEVTGHAGFTAPSGKVVVHASLAHSCTATLKASGSTGTGTCTLSGLPASSYDLTETYSGDARWDSSTAAHVTALTIGKAATKTTLALSHTSVTRGHESSEHFSVRVTPRYAGISPTGHVTVKEGSKKLCVVTLKRGKGTCSPAKQKLGSGKYKVKASYGGSSSLKASTSAKRSLTVRS